MNPIVRVDSHGSTAPLADNIQRTIIHSADLPFASGRCAVIGTVRLDPVTLDLIVRIEQYVRNPDADEAFHKRIGLLPAVPQDTVDESEPTDAEPVPEDELTLAAV